MDLKNRSTQTESDFDDLSWHDNQIHGIEFRTGDVDNDDWTSELVFDIDFIVEWICGVDGIASFRIAPATLCFHGVTDLKMNLNSQDTGFQAMLRTLSIFEVERERIENQKVHLDRPYYLWRIVLSDPAQGAISFGATGFTQEFRGDPVFSSKQKLSRQERPCMERR